MRALVIAAVSAALPAGCAQGVPGRAGESSRLDPLKVAGLAITTGESGPRQGSGSASALTRG